VRLEIGARGVAEPPRDRTARSQPSMSSGSTRSALRPSSSTSRSTGMSDDTIAAPAAMYSNILSGDIQRLVSRSPTATETRRWYGISTRSNPR
jgi:hypothetical protein